MSTGAPKDELEAALVEFDKVDTAVRELHTRVARDPDLIVEYEPALRELHRKRLELARQAGVAALADWRASKAAAAFASGDACVQAEGSAEPEYATEGRAGDASATQGHAAEALATEPPPASEPPPREAVSAEVLARDTPEQAPSEPPSASSAPPSAPASAPAPPLSARQIEEFMTSLAASPSAPAAPRKSDASLLLALASHVKIAEDVRTSGAWEHDLEQLERAASEDRQKRWREMSPEARVRWLSLLVAWTRALQDEAARLGEPDGRAREVFRGLRGFSTTDRPGFVNGFARAAMPRWGGTWREDALAHLREIRPAPAAASPKPAARKAAKAKAAEADADDAGVDSSELADWAYLPRVRGLRVVLLGGEVREERRAALEEAFGFGSLEWVPTDRPRLLASLAERAARGTVDFILATKFVRHKETDAIARAAETPLLTLRHGYGVTAVRQAFEEWFARGDERAGKARRSG